MPQARPAVKDRLSLGCLLQHALYTTLCVTRCSSLAPSLSCLFAHSVPFRFPRPLPGVRSGVAWCVCGGGAVGGGGGVERKHRSPSPGVSLCGGRCLRSTSRCNAVVRGVPLYPLRTNGPAS